MVLISIRGLKSNFKMNDKNYTPSSATRQAREDSAWNLKVGEEADGHRQGNKMCHVKYRTYHLYSWCGLFQLPSAMTTWVNIANGTRARHGTFLMVKASLTPQLPRGIMWSVHGKPSNIARPNLTAWTRPCLMFLFFFLSFTTIRRVLSVLRGSWNSYFIVWIEILITN